MAFGSQEDFDAMKRVLSFLVQASLALPLLLHPAMALGETPGGRPAGDQPHYRILHIMSYNSPWRWTDGQLDGFKDALQGLDAEYKVFQMDTKRNSSAAMKEKVGLEARELIASWKPDLVYTTDDDAQEYVARHFVNAKIPFVFSGVNKDPAAYGFRGSSNVTGVLEQEHFVESVRLLRDIVPGIGKIAVVLDDASMWAPVEARMRSRLGELAGIELGPWDVIRTFEEFKRVMAGYRGRVDAVALIGIFNFKDGQGKNVPYQDVLRWTAENSTLPDFGYWIDRVYFGTLCAVTVSEFEQGRAAGVIAREILAGGKSPALFPMEPTVKGLPVVSLARAKRLGLKIPTSVLLSAEVVQQFDWEK